MPPFQARATDNGSDNFGRILRTERARSYYIFNIVHNYAVHSVLCAFHAKGFIKKRYRALNDQGLEENLVYLRGLRAGHRRLLMGQISLLATMSLVLAVSVIFDTTQLFLFPALIGLSIQAMTSGSRAAEAYLTIRRVSPYLANVVTMLSAEHQVAPAGIIDGQNAIKLERIHSIAFDDVWFRYSDTDEWTLKAINLTLHADDGITAIVGMNGAGKSTLLALAAGILPPSRGRVLVNGVDLRDIDIRWYLDQIGFLSQDTHLFAATIRENIEADRPSPDTQWTVTTLRSLNSGERLLDKLNSHVESLEEDNVSISGGEAQRVAFARVLAREGVQWYLLDEPTSAMDPNSEDTVLRHLRDITGKPTLVVTHNISACQQADLIIVIEHGAIVEQGSYRHLTSAPTRLSQLLAQQHRNRHDASSGAA